MRIKCKTKRCKGKNSRAGLCWSCYNKKRHDADPIKYSYQALKDNAKRRGKPFTITLNYFKRFCYKTKYIQGKGKERDSFTIDCIDPEKGYVPGNIQILTFDDNRRKQNKKILNYDWRTKEAKVITDKVINYKDQPF